MKKPLTPQEEIWFEVNPMAINQALFQTERDDPAQEEVRLRILEAFEEVKRNPKYAQPFETLRPAKTWSIKTVAELEDIASERGDGYADLTEHDLKLAQRLSNGESWISICNNPDTAKWPRIVVDKNGYARRVGGSCYDYSNTPVAHVHYQGYFSDATFDGSVPLIVRRRK